MPFIENWTSSWRWISMQCYAAVTALNVTWIATPADLKTQTLNRAVEALTVLLSMAGMFGRLVQQKKVDGP